MKTLKILSKASLLAGLFLSLATTESKAYLNSDTNNPPNPSDTKSISLNIFNKTDMIIKTSFFLDNKKIYSGKKIDPGQSLIYNVEGRYNKENAYFRFRISGDEHKYTGVKFFYKRIAKARGSKIDAIYLLQDNENNFVISTTEEINPITTLLKADINAQLIREPKTIKDKKAGKTKKHKRSNEN
jgi:hypothetical protein